MACRWTVQTAVRKIRKIYYGKVKRGVCSNCLNHFGFIYENVKKRPSPLHVIKLQTQTSSFR